MELISAPHFASVGSILLRRESASWFRGRSATDSCFRRCPRSDVPTVTRINVPSGSFKCFISPLILRKTVLNNGQVTGSIFMISKYCGPFTFTVTRAATAFFFLDIYPSVKRSGMSAAEMGRKANMSRSGALYHVRKLQAKGFLSRKSRSKWELKYEYNDIVRL